MTVLRADRFDRGRRSNILLFLFDMRKDSAQVLVLSDRGVGHALFVRIENTAGQGDAFGRQLNVHVRHLVNIYVFSNKAPALEPTVIRAMDLNERAKAFPAQAWLAQRLALFARQPKTVFLHPFANCLSLGFEPVMIGQYRSEN